MNTFFSLRMLVIGVVGGVVAVSSILFWKPGNTITTEYIAPVHIDQVAHVEEQTPASVSQMVLPPPPVHIETPSSVRAIYMTSWVAGTPSFRSGLVRFIQESEINAVVIDVKDYTGKVAFKTGDSYIEEIGAEEIRVPDMHSFIEELHSAGIYTIARISVFQDPHFALVRPDIAVQTKDGSTWADHKGLSWIDPAAQDMWDYTIRVARATEYAGFDELNFDYIRFPSDGNMQDIAYPVWDGVTERADILEQFFAYLDVELSDLPVPISLDLFGMTMTNVDDLYIGQVLEKAAPYADYIAPMVYPSHYPATWHGLANPAANPYEVIHYAMSQGERRLDIMRMSVTSTSSPLYGKEIAELRPWLQDFDLGAEYTADMVIKQKQAVYDAGLHSWMVWDPKNIYTKEAFR